MKLLKVVGILLWAELVGGYPINSEDDIRLDKGHPRDYARDQEKFNVTYIKGDTTGNTEINHSLSRKFTYFNF